MDPLTESYHEWGAYVFSGNRVVDSFELEGLEPVQAGEVNGETQMQSDMEWTWSAETGNWGIELEMATLTGQGRATSNSTSGSHYIPFLSEMKGYVDPFLPNLDGFYNSQGIAENSAGLQHDIMNTSATRQMVEGEKFLSSLAPGGGTEEIIQSWDDGNYWYAGALTVMEIPGLKVLKFGKFAKVVGVSEEFAAKGGVNTVEQVAVHGNSLKSLKPTWGYKLYSADGTFLKNGITSAVKAESRYTKSFMSDKFMKEKILFPNRKAAYDWEYLQNQIMRGPLNKNMH